MRTEASLVTRLWRQSKNMLLLGVIACSGAIAWAQTNSVQAPSPEAPEISLEKLMKMEIPIVEAASKYKQKITEAPSSVTIISSEEVKRYGYRTLAEILESAPGLYTTYDRNYSYLGVRGFNLGDIYTRNSRVLVLVDGHRMNNSLTDGAAIGTDFILDVDLIERVEIIRGPGSSLYGNNAFFGVINVITRNGAGLPGHGTEVSGEAASYDSYKGRLTYGNRFGNGLELLLSGTLYDSEGHDQLFFKEFNSPQNNNGIAQNADADDSKSCFAKLAFQDFTLEGGYIWRQKGNPTAQFLTDFNDPRLRTTDERSYAALKFNHDFEDLFNVTAQLYYDRQDFKLAEPYVGVLYQDLQTADWAGLEVQLTRTLWERLTLTLGGEYRNDFNQHEQFRNAQTGEIFTDVHQSRDNYGIYFQGDFAVLTNLHFNAGVRYDQYGDFDPSANPRLALIYNPFGASVFKAIYGTAFRTPNFFELRNPQFASQLKPENITTYELVYEQGIGRHLRSSVSGFYNEIEDLILFNSAPGHSRYENLEGARAKGVELALEAIWPSGIRGRASYSFQQTEDRATGQVLTDSPEHLGKLNVSVPLWQEKIFAGAEFLYVSRRTTVHLNPIGEAVPGADAAGYGVLNFTLFSQNLINGLELSATLYNAADKKFFAPATPFHVQDTIEQDGRSFRVKLTYHF